MWTSVGKIISFSLKLLFNSPEKNKNMVYPTTKFTGLQGFFFSRLHWNNQFFKYRYSKVISDLFKHIAIHIDHS